MSTPGAGLLQQAMAWHNQGRLPDAAAAYRRLLAAEPGNADALHLLGVAVAQMGSPQEAIELIRAALRVRPNSPMAHNNLGNAYRAASRHAEALKSYDQATRLKPDYVEAHGSAGHMLIALDRVAEALTRAERTLRLKPDFPDALICRGIAYGKLERHEDALESFDRVIALNPRHADAWYNRGNVLGSMRRHEEALASFERALSIQPNYVHARWNSALLKLLRGEWREGWERYESRFDMDRLLGRPLREFSQPRWRGRESLSGKTILLWAERGLGDTIQFSRYVRALAGSVILEVQPPLKALLEGQFPGVRVIAQGEPTGDFDYHCPLMSLPLAFGTELDRVPAATAYLKADAASWAQRLPAEPAIKVGIAWQGNPEAEKNWAHGRSAPLTAFRDLARDPNIRLVSLQTGPLPKVDFAASITSFGDCPFVDTAAIMTSLDLVITVDTSIAHLAGALGVPVWVALHTTSEWRWLLDRPDSPWYPSMRLFRQERRGDWSRVFATMGAELRQAVPGLLSAKLSNQGVRLEQTGDFQGAAQRYQSALELDSNNAITLHNLGNALMRLARHGEAAQCYQRAVNLKPDFAAAWCNHAGALLALKRYPEALASSDQAIALNDTLAQAWYTRGAALQELERTTEALRSCERALSLRKDYPDAIYARATVLRAMGDYRAAVAGFQEALRLDPNLEAARISAVVAEIPLIPSTAAEVAAARESFAVALRDLEADLLQRPCTDVPAFVGAMQPFYLAYHQQNNRDLLAAHGRLCAALMGEWQRRVGLPAPVAPESRRARLRVGIVSAQIFSHSVYVALTRGWLRRLDPERFELEVFHLGAKSDAETEAARALAAHFEAGVRSVKEWAEAILARQPDILIYPELGMDQQSLRLASLRLAPTQVAAWGHPVTSGLPNVDYYLSAEAFEPEDAAGHYTEQLIRLPNLGSYFEPGFSVPSVTPGEPDRAPVFVCPGTPFKYAPEYDKVLVEIARRLGRCQFHFFSYQDGILTRLLLDRLHAEFAAAGLDGTAYLVVHPWMPPAEFYRLLQSADLMLDTIGFSGFNTVMQALACGLPVVTFRGGFMRGRLGSGVLERLSLHGLIADSPECYTDIAVTLAQDPAAREELREQLRQRLPHTWCDQGVIDALEKFLLAAGTRDRGERQTVTSPE